MVSDRECGIDCENVRDFRPNVMKRAFSEKEREMVEKAPENEKNLLFFRLWTLKEAYVKALGVGISYPMDTAEFSFDGENIITDIENCRFRQFILKNGSFVVSVCEINNGDN
jgi:4'-phosphopantetheinyl transferase